MGSLATKKRSEKHAKLQRPADATGLGTQGLLRMLAGASRGGGGGITILNLRKKSLSHIIGFPIIVLRYIPQPRGLGVSAFLSSLKPGVEGL